MQVTVTHNFLKFIIYLNRRHDNQKLEYEMKNCGLSINGFNLVLKRNL